MKKILIGLLVFAGLFTSHLALKADDDLELDEASVDEAFEAEPVVEDAPPAISTPESPVAAEGEMPASQAPIKEATPETKPMKEKKKEVKKAKKSKKAKKVKAKAKKKNKKKNKSKKKN